MTGTAYIIHGYDNSKTNLESKRDIYEINIILLTITLNIIMNIISAELLTLRTFILKLYKILEIIIRHIN